MKKALISPQENPISYISSWVSRTQPVNSYYPNSCRIAEVADSEFEIAPPLFWVNCADDVTAENYWFDTSNDIINPIVNAPQPPA